MRPRESSVQTSGLFKSLQIGYDLTRMAQAPCLVQKAADKESDSDSVSEAESFLSDEDEEDYPDSERMDPSEEESEADDSVLSPSRSPSMPPSPQPSSVVLSPDHSPPESPRLSPIASRRKRKMPLKRSRSKSGRRGCKSSCLKLGLQQTRWNSTEDADIGPEPKKFTPKRKPGHQLTSLTGQYSPLDLFSLFIDRTAVNILCNNTNKQAAKNIAKGKKYMWTKLEETELYKYLGLTFYMSLVKLHSVSDYWKQNTIFSQVFPPKVMSRERFRTISWNIHMSDPDEDVDNDNKKGTPEYDQLFRLRPLLDTLTTACKSNYHPRQNIAIDKRRIATKARTGMTQYMKAKSVKWGFKLFVLADSDNGYTVDFSIYTAKSQCASGNGLPYDSVMSLIKPSYLGDGYHLYVDNYYTSPKLFRDLYDMNIGACGTYSENRKDCPRTQNNALTKKSVRGDIRWIRDGPLLFVKWTDLREVSICSTIHPAFTGETVMRRIKDNDGSWITEAFLCPTPIIEYNKHMGGVELSDRLIQYYTVHTTYRWYRTIFYHFLNIAVTNAYILHKELCKEKKQTPMTHRGFLKELTAQLCRVTLSVPPIKATALHLPVPLRPDNEKSKGTSYGRRSCIHCWATIQKRQATPWKCQACDVALCLVYYRNCFYEWHQ